jgi:uncharacterized protein YciI
LEQYFDDSSSSLNAMSNAISSLLGSQDPNDQTALQTLEASAQEAATTISQAAVNVQNKVYKTFLAAEHKVRQSWFSPPKAQTKYHQFLFQASQVGMYINDNWDTLNDLAAGGVFLYAGDISDYDTEALAAVNQENVGNPLYSAGMDGLMALL